MEAGAFELLTAEPDLRSPAEHLDEFTEDTRAQLMRTLRMSVRVMQDTVERVSRLCYFDFGAIIGHLEPALNERLVCFEMELQAVGAIAKTKCLMWTRRCAGQVHGSLRQIERIRMPLEDVLVAIEMATQTIGLSVDGWMDAIPADLAHGIRTHVCAERCRQQLCAEADAKNGNLATHCFANCCDLQSEVRVTVYLIHIHRAAQDNQPVVSADVRLRVGVTRKIDVAHAEAGFAQQRIEYAEGLGRRMLENKEFAHAVPK